MAGAPAELHVQDTVSEPEARGLELGTGAVCGGGGGGHFSFLNHRRGQTTDRSLSEISCSTRRGYGLTCQSGRTVRRSRHAPRVIVQQRAACGGNHIC